MATHPAIADQQMQRFTLWRGEVRIIAGTETVTTVLGSCVAACLLDPVARIGGMNHFLLGEPASPPAPAAREEHYGAHLMETLVSGMIAHGANRQSLCAHLYGGANLYPGMARIGTENAEFARLYLERIGIPVMHEDLGGQSARRIEFHPASGMVRCRIIQAPPDSEPWPLSCPHDACREFKLCQNKRDQTCPTLREY